MNTLKNILKKISCNGRKITDIKEAILKSLISSSKPISIPEIQKELAKKNITPNKTTIYREISTLQNENIIKEILIDSKTKKYELVNEDEHHHHIVCKSCNQINEFEPPKELEEDFKKFEKILSKKNNFKITDHSFEFFGLCNKCNK